MCVCVFSLWLVCLILQVTECNRHFFIEFIIITFYLCFRLFVWILNIQPTQTTFSHVHVRTYIIVSQQQPSHNTYRHIIATYWHISKQVQNWQMLLHRCFVFSHHHGRRLESVHDIKSKLGLCQLMCIYRRNNPAKFHPDLIWNDRASNLLKRSPQQEQEDE